MTDYVIETDGLCKAGGGGFRVRDLRMQVPRGCVYGFLGPNGAGKTTTMKLLLGLIQPTAGSITILGQKASRKNRLALNLRTGSLIESPSYYGHLTGLENMEVFARYKKAPRAQAESLLEAVGLYGRRNQKARHYSLGMKQRLGIALALLGSPEILILDEPTNGLDPAGIQEIRALIKQMPARFNATVIVSSHLLAEIDQMADYAGIINNGSLIYQGALAELEKRGGSLEEIFLSMTGGASEGWASYSAHGAANDAAKGSAESSAKASTHSVANGTAEASTHSTANGSAKASAGCAKAEAPKPNGGEA